MKKNTAFINLVIFMVVVLLIGCGGKRNVNEPENTETAYTTDDTSTVSEEDDSQEIDYGESIVHMRYFGFEEGVSVSTHVVEARCLDVYVEGPCTYAVFEPIEVFRGKVDEESIIIRSLNECTIYLTDFVGNYYFWEDLTRYEVGKEYLLIYQKVVDVCAKYDCGQILGDIFIPKDAVETATMFGRVPLTQLVQLGNRICNDYDKLVAYICELSEQNPSDRENVGTDYIRSDRLEDIVEQTNVIVKVKITNHSVIGSCWDREDCYCQVVETLKGEELTGEINVVVPLDSIVTGEEYIFMIEPAGSFYIMSSKNSVYSADDVEAIEKIEELIKQAE